MSETHLMILLSASVIACCLSIMKMLSLYRKLVCGLSLVSFCLHHIIIKGGQVRYEDGLPMVIEDSILK